MCNSIVTHCYVVFTGTYNNQYMILDMKKISLGKFIDDNALWVVEQIPTLVKSADTTSILRAGKNKWTLHLAWHCKLYWCTVGCMVYENLNGSYIMYDNKLINIYSWFFFCVIILAIMQKKTYINWKSFKNRLLWNH